MLETQFSMVRISYIIISILQSQECFEIIVRSGCPGLVSESNCDISL